MTYEIQTGDAVELASRLDQEVQTIITSPPYWGLRDYKGGAAEIGNERASDEYIGNLVELFSKLRESLSDDGTLWLNLGDTYNAYNGGAGPSSKISKGAQTRERPKLESGFGFRDKTRKPKDLLGMPWRVALALQSDGWYLRQDIIWHKPNPMPESVRDRCVKAHEYLFLLSKSKKYKFHTIKEPATYAGQNRGGSSKRYEQNAAGMDRKKYDTRTKRSVWSIKPAVFKGAHFATFPEALIDPCVKASTDEGDLVLDPFTGAGTTALVALKNKRRFLGFELNPEYVEIAENRIFEDFILT